MTNLAGFVVAALVALSSPGTATPLAQRTIPGSSPSSSGSRKDLLYDELAQRWLARQEYGPESTPKLKLENLLDERFTRLDWGALELRIPPEALQDPRWCKRITTSLGALLKAQNEFLSWLAGPEARKAVVKDTKPAIKVLTKWLKSVRPRLFSDPDAFRGQSLIEVLQPKQAIVDALEAFNAYCLQGGPLAREVQLIPARIVFQPERRDLVEFACTVGLLRPDLRNHYWVSGLENWTMFDFDGTRVIGMDYAGPRAKDDLSDVIPMDGRNKKAIEEHVVQLGVRSLMESVSRGKIEPMLAAGLANDLVIEIYGEVDTRSDGDLKSRSTSGRSVFVPGGNPNGGFLPPTNADSRWRADKGKDRFWGVLKGAQKAGGKRGKKEAEKLGRFRINNDSQSGKRLMAAPFLGPKALTPPPREYIGDYAELLRAYRVGFLGWLRAHGAGKTVESKKRFSELLRAVTNPREQRGLPRLFQEIYGIPLSAPGTEALFEEDCLEGRFLAWLPKS